jgi:hypothetical protein
MGEVMSWAAALAFLGVMRAWDARQEERTSRQEEVFVPFNLPSMKPEPTEEARLPVAVPASSSEAQPVGV